MTAGVHRKGLEGPLAPFLPCFSQIHRLLPGAARSGHNDEHGREEG